MKRSKLEPDHPGFRPMYQKAGWKRNEMVRGKALKRGNWLKGGKDKKEWKKLPKTTNKKIMKATVEFGEKTERKGRGDGITNWFQHKIPGGWRKTGGE